MDDEFVTIPALGVLCICEISPELHTFEVLRLVKPRVRESRVVSVRVDPLGRSLGGARIRAQETR